MTGRAEFYTEK